MEENTDCETLVETYRLGNAYHISPMDMDRIDRDDPTTSPFDTSQTYEARSHSAPNHLQHGELRIDFSRERVYETQSLIPDDESLIS